MISYLKWKVVELNVNSLCLLTNGGVGYEVGINELTYSKLCLDWEFGLYVYHHITEWNQSLFWFIEFDEKKVFSELIKISWVWWKVAMQILSLGIERLLLSISWEDNKTIESIKWIGKKMAEKIIIELKDKDFGIVISSSENIKKANCISSDLHSSIKSTLVNMGYNPKDIDNVLLDLPENIDNAWIIIPYVIKELS